jgi:SAM-dependent methyltransferase
MTEEWERFAADDPLFFIEADPRLRGSMDEFLESGRRMAEWALGWLGDRARRGRLLEVGCGLGRTSRAFADHFDQVDGVDVAPSMIERAEQIGLPANLHLVVGSGHDLEGFRDGAYDVVFSHLVFQHLPEDEQLAGYIGEIRRVLAPGGAALIQLDTRPRSTVASLVQALPDALLPRKRRRHMRRYRRSPERVAELIAQAGLRVEQQHGSGTAEHWLLLRILE